MIKLVIATGNTGKIRDFQHVFNAEQINVEILSVNAFGGMPNVEETEPDFKGNALLKAQAAKSILPRDQELWVLADDSGLSVDALGGEPGVYSARFAGESASDEENRNKLLSKLEHIENNNRQASFVCHLCLISPKQEVFHFEGRCHGTIAHLSSGENGFGYDPLFIPKGGDKTWGEIGGHSKNQESHRGNASKKLMLWLYSQRIS